MNTPSNEEREKTLARLLGSQARARILILFLGHQEKRFYQREVMYEAGLSLYPTQRKLANLVQLGILQKHCTPVHVFYQVNSLSPLLQPLSMIVEGFMENNQK